ncbi:hypothetical protein PAG69_06925, partial [Klebsiella quasipneumoniae]|uniref:hypothetical protein n=2 Tax=Klebsiella quasipneumoniae TaxID=1463165 RepID=UPI0028425208
MTTGDALTSAHRLLLPLGRDFSLFKLLMTAHLGNIVVRGVQHQFVREGANKQVISSQADSLIKISRIWAD